MSRCPAALLSLAVLLFAPVVRAAHPAISNCSSGKITVCFYDSTDIVQASPASQGTWSPGEVKAGVCNGSPCKIRLFLGATGCGTGSDPNFDTAADDSYWWTGSDLTKASDDPNYFWNSGVSKCGMTPIGGRCTLNQDCRDGNSCADGYCCNSPCSESCQACNVSGHLGQCTGVAEHGSDDQCIGDLVWCEGGHCVIKPQPNGHTCTQANQCASGVCSNHYCRAPNGTTCSSINECQSNNCVDGVCCDGACNGTCQACNLPGTAGQCKPLATGTTDATCAAPKVCNGAGSCRSTPGGTCAGDPDCLSGVCTLAPGQTTGTGVCCNQSCTGECMSCSVPGKAGTCSPDPIGSNDLMCVQPEVCNGAGHCGLPPGSTCNADSDCEGSPGAKVCARPAGGKTGPGVCCDTACGGTCMSCSIPGHVGYCTADPYGSNDLVCKAPNHCTGRGACGSLPGGSCNDNQDCSGLPGATTCSKRIMGSALNRIVLGFCCAKDCGPCATCQFSMDGSCQPLPDGENPGCNTLQTCKAGVCKLKSGGRIPGMP